MIISNLNDCCYKCTQPNLNIETSTYESFNLEVFEKTQVIECSHCKVCKYYLEEDAERGEQCRIV